MLFGIFKGELENLLVAGDLSVIGEKSAIPLLLKLLMRLLKYESHRAENSLSIVLLHPRFMQLIGIQPEALNFIPDACLLAPSLAPRVLHQIVANGLLGGSMNAVISMVEEALHRLSLDGLDVACIEHAASGLLSTAVGPKFPSI